MSHDSFTVVLQSARMITPRVRELTFVREDRQTSSYKPGQFITLYLPWKDSFLRRDYSIANLANPQHTQEFQIAVAFVENGRATSLLFAMESGERFKASGPYGRFVLRDESHNRYIFIATSTGVTPYRAMLSELAHRIDKRGNSAVLLLGVRNREELLYGNDFLEFAARHPGFRFLACYSREIPESPELYEKQGYVQDQLLELTLNPESDIVYLCGNPNMIDDVFGQLKRLGFKMANVRREKYVFAN